MKLKKYLELRETTQKKMEEILNKAEAEERALNEEEIRAFEEAEKELEAIDKTIAALQSARKMFEPEQREGTVEEGKTEEGAAKEGAEDGKEEAEERAFDCYIRGVVEERADVNLDTGTNGAVIPSSIAKKIIKKLYEISPIYQLATKYNVKGTLSIPYYDEEEQRITMAYATEFTELSSTSGKFKSIELKGFLAGALSKVSKSLVNNSDFDLVSFVVNAMAESAARWIENELLNGTEGKITGLSTCKQGVEAAAATSITADELIQLQECIPDAYQNKAIWIMNKETRTAIRLLKDNEGRYILNPDATARWGYTLFGKDVYTSDNMPKMEAGKTAVYYGDMSGLAVKVVEEMEIEVLREKYATQHAIGVVGWLEMDAKIEDEQKVAKLEMKATA